jgi:hypothetical protein
MKRFTSVALAGALAVSAVAATATGAAADKWKGKYKGPHYSYNYYGPSAGTVAGAAIFGLALGALAAPLFNPYPYPAPYPYAYYPPPPPTPYPAYPVYPTYAYDPHIAWCSEQYQSYNAGTNTWVDFYGVVRVCVSPY